jgi:hypothetical protein
MIINTKNDWEKILASGAVVVWETKLFKIFRMPNGDYWRVLPRWRRAWRFEILVRAIDLDVI